MRSIPIQGLVRIATGVRTELAAGVSPQRRETLRRHVGHTLAQVRQMLVQSRADLRALAAPSRQAFQFLADIDWDAAARSPAAAAPPAKSNVTFTGLKTFIDGSCDALCAAASAEDLRRTHNAIAAMSETLERRIADDRLTAAHLRPPARQARGWLAMMAQESYFQAYLQALGQTLPLMEDAARAGRLARRVILRYRPISALFRYRVKGSEMILDLPTPMIAFDAAQARLLPPFVLHRRGRSAILAATRGEPYRALERLLEQLGGNGDQAAGVYHDLDASFARVNAEYFDGLLNKPRLSWSRAATLRKFGHYDELHDAVMVSCTLDQAGVPAAAVDYVMYHELLHKKLGIRYSRGRKSAHTAAFAAAEKQFRLYDQAKAVLDNLARTGRP